MAGELSSREIFSFRGVLSWISSRPPIAERPARAPLEQIARAMLAQGHLRVDIGAPVADSSRHRTETPRSRRATPRLDRPG